MEAIHELEPTLHDLKPLRAVLLTFPYTEASFEMILIVGFPEPICLTSDLAMNDSTCDRHANINVELWLYKGCPVGLPFRYTKVIQQKK